MNYRVGEKVILTGTRSIPEYRYLNSPIFKRLLKNNNCEILEVIGDGSGKDLNNCLRVGIKSDRIYVHPDDIILTKNPPFISYTPPPLNFYFKNLHYHLGIKCRELPRNTPLQIQLKHIFGDKADTIEFSTERFNNTVNVYVEDFIPDRQVVLHSSGIDINDTLYQNEYDNLLVFGDALSEHLKKPILFYKKLEGTLLKEMHAELLVWKRGGYQIIYIENCLNIIYKTCTHPTLNIIAYDFLNSDKSLLQYYVFDNIAMLARSKKEVFFCIKIYSFDKLSVLIPCIKDIPLSWFDNTKFNELFEYQQIEIIAQTTEHLRLELINDKELQYNTLITDIHESEIQYIQQMAEIGKLKSLLNLLKQDENQFRTIFLNHLKIIKEHKKVKQVYFKGNFLCIKTRNLIGYVDGKNYALGRAIINISILSGFDKPILFEALDSKIVLFVYNSIKGHPHVYSSKHLCFGNSMKAVGQLVRDQEYSVLISLILQFLEYGIDTRDTMHRISLWKTMEELSEAEVELLNK